MLFSNLSHSSYLYILQATKVSIKWHLLNYSASKSSQQHISPLDTCVICLKMNLLHSNVLLITCIALPHTSMSWSKMFVSLKGVCCMSFTPTRSQELAAPRPHCCPEVGRELLGVLVLQDELGYGSFPQRPACPHCPHTALLLHQLAVHQGHQLPLHWPAEHARTQICHTCKWWQLCGKTMWNFNTIITFTLVMSHFFIYLMDLVLNELLVKICYNQLCMWI